MKMILDRINKDQNGKIIACFEVGDDIIKVREENMPSGFATQLYSNVIIECEYVDGKIVNPVLLVEETEARLAKIREKLSGLGNKGNKI